MKKVCCFIIGLILLQSCKKGELDGPELRSEAKKEKSGMESWLSLAALPNAPGSFSQGTAFVIGNKAYVGSGEINYFGYTFAEYDLSTNTWEIKNDHPGLEKASGVGFSIGNKGYYGGGEELGGSDLYPTTVFNEYEPTNDTWTAKAPLPIPLSEAVSFTIDGKAYVGTGWTYTVSEDPDTGFPVYDFSFTDDFFEYTPQTDTWKKIADFPGGPRLSAVAFSIGKKGYVGTGRKPDQTGASDLWEYDPKKDKWTKKADFPEKSRYEAVAFSISSVKKGYVGSGFTLNPNGADIVEGDFWEYDPAKDSWQEIEQFATSRRYRAMAFSTECNGYVIGGNGPGDQQPDWYNLWQYTPKAK